jgi:hypothetical protein
MIFDIINKLQIIINYVWIIYILVTFLNQIYYSSLKLYQLI